MRREEFRNTLRTEPFRPFTMHLANGRSVRVAHPEFVLFLGDNRTVIVANSQDDSFEVVDLSLVADLEVHATNDGDEPKNSSGDAA